MLIEGAMYEAYAHGFIFQCFKGNGHFAGFLRVGYGYPRCADLPGKGNMKGPFKFDHSSPVASEIIRACLKTMSIDIGSDGNFFERALRPGVLSRPPVLQMIYKNGKTFFYWGSGDDFREYGGFNGRRHD